MSASKMSETLLLAPFLTCKPCTPSALINRSWPPVTACHVPPPTFYSRQGQDHHLEGQGHDQRILQRDIHYKCRANNTTTSTGRRSEGDGCGVRGCGSADFKSLTRADKVDDHQLERRPPLARHPSGWNSVCSRSCHTGRHEGAMVAGGEAEVSMPMFFPVSRRQGQTSREQELHDRSQAFETIKTD